MRVAIASDAEAGFSAVISGPSAGGPRGDHPRDVIPGPSAGDSLAAGNIDLPEEVANDELDDLWILRAATHCRQSDEIMMQSISLKVCTLHNPPSLARKCRTVVRPRARQLVISRARPAIL